LRRSIYPSNISRMHNYGRAYLREHAWRKTHLIAQTLKRHNGPKPILILTHTNSGVAALRLRLDRAGVPARAYRLATIDGWAMRLTGMFPGRSNVGADILRLINPKTDYPAIRHAAWQLLKGGHVQDVLASSYARLSPPQRSSRLSGNLSRGALWPSLQSRKLTLNDAACGYPQTRSCD
jgi:hypothetical protein